MIEYTPKVVNLHGVASHMVELLAARGGDSPAIREQRIRLSHALRTVGVDTAEIPLTGIPAHDLPLAVAACVRVGIVDSTAADQYVYVGELALCGDVRPIHGALSMAEGAGHNGRAIVVPIENAPEAAHGSEAYGTRTLREVIDALNGTRRLPRAVRGSTSAADTRAWSDVKGQETAKRQIESAIADGRGVLLVGPPGSGKTMIARRIPGLLPPMTYEESLETTRVHSVAGLLRPGESLVAQRPFRAPHHTVSDAGLVGGGSPGWPGEVSLAHNGVLFLNELSEFRRNALDALQRTLKDGRVTLYRARESIQYPARARLVAAMNPCPCGFRGVETAARPCTCTASSIARYEERCAEYAQTLGLVQIAIGAALARGEAP